jgi:hypothetical protein
MKTSSKAKSRCFKFLSEAAIRAERFDISAWQSAQLRATLPKGIYWIQPVERGKILWNLILLIDYLTSGDRPEHQILVEEYIATLPSVG